MNDETKAFLEDLKEVCKKHLVYLSSAEQYGHNEIFLGVEYEFLGAKGRDGSFRIVLGMEDLEEHIGIVKSPWILDEWRKLAKAGKDEELSALNAEPPDDKADVVESGE